VPPAAATEQLLLGLWLLYAVNVLLRARTEVMWRERRSKWVNKLVKEGNR